ncbi:hypothetical protein [Rhizobium leguminosarum]|uniref:hypothetical protein n=1 Tax=Rhizobium leguminosarum TaxID=384 RepID=UPI00144165B1|nr:hypothetical protein [Rhizobium leguminosarum]
MWLELHDSDGKSIFVNMENATDFRRWNADDLYTQIAVGGFGEKGRIVHVVEDPGTIKTMIDDAQLRSR